MPTPYDDQLKKWAKRTARIMKDYRAGVAKADIARKHGISPQRAHKIIQREQAKQEATK